MWRLQWEDMPDKPRAFAGLTGVNFIIHGIGKGRRRHQSPRGALKQDTAAASPTTGPGLVPVCEDGSYGQGRRWFSRGGGSCQRPGPAAAERQVSWGGRGLGDRHALIELASAAERDEDKLLSPQELPPLSRRPCGSLTVPTRKKLLDFSSRTAEQKCPRSRSHRFTD